ncbi:MAG: chemotaxis protein CheX [Halanaerobiales bacterium]
MSDDILDLYVKYFKKAMQEISSELLGIGFKESINLDKELYENKKKFDIIVGITGDYKGRFLLETTEMTARIISEVMNYGPLDKESDLYLYMGEFVNILSGRAITFINNLDNGKIVRLTPPAIFTGVNLEISTPNIKRSNIVFIRNKIQIRLDIGLEGV